MEKLKTIHRARSKKNGIIFYSNKFPLIGTEVYLNDLGNIEIRVIFTDLDEAITLFQNQNEKKTAFKKNFIVIFDIAIIVLSIILAAFFGNFGLVTASICFCLCVSFDLFSFALNSYEKKSKNGKKRTNAKFHAAEHMAINAYEDLQRIPTLEEIKSYSRFSEKCGSVPKLCQICLFSFLSIVTAFLSSNHFFIYAIIICLYIIFLLIIKKYKWYGWVTFLQVFITSKPSDKELELAIEGLKQFEIMEEKIDNNDFSLLEIEFPSYQ